MSNPSKCPACGARLRFKHALQLGEFMVCDECDAQLEVIQMSPIRLDQALGGPFDEEAESEADESDNEGER